MNSSTLVTWVLFFLLGIVTPSWKTWRFWAILAIAVAIQLNASFNH